MITTLSLSPGVTLRHCPADRFKKGALSFQLLRPMNETENSLNALLPAVLLRGTAEHPDIRSITERLDDLYGASIGALVRRVGDLQTVGFYLSFMEDRFALPGDAVFGPMVDFLGETLLRPLLKDGAFCPEIVEGEKKNLISTIESELNDKRAYAAARMLRTMCAGDSFAVARLGTVDGVAAITPQSLYAHYRHILRRSRVEIFYVGSVDCQEVARLLTPLARELAAQPEAIAPQTAFTPRTQPQEFSEELEIAQAKLSMGFTTSITNREPDFAAMQMFNTIFGSGMTSKLFMNVREKLSLCYYVSSAYYGSKGVFTVSSGIDQENYDRTRAEILAQLEQCCRGNITAEEMEAGRQALLSSLRATPDSPGALEGYYATAPLSGLNWTTEEYMERIRAVTAGDVARAARSLKLHTVFLLKGVTK